MDKYKKINCAILGLYSLLLLVVGVFRAPFYVVWGPEKNIATHTHAAIWSSVVPNKEINGYNLMYQIDFQRLLCEIAVITLIAAALLLLVDRFSKE